MLSKRETLKIIRLDDLSRQWERLYKEVCSILENKYSEVVDFDNGDSIGSIIAKEEIPKSAQKDQNGIYVTYMQQGEDWGSGTVYIPLNNEYEEYLQVHYST